VQENSWAAINVLKREVLRGGILWRYMSIYVCARVCVQYHSNTWTCVLLLADEGRPSLWN